MRCCPNKTVTWGCSGEKRSSYHWKDLFLWNTIMFSFRVPTKEARNGGNIMDKRAFRIQREETREGLKPEGDCLHVDWGYSQEGFSEGRESQTNRKVGIENGSGKP